MSVQNINAYNMSLTDYLTPSKEKDENSVSGADALLSRSARNNALSAYGGNMLSGPGQAAMQRAVQELREAHGGPVTFAMVREYREEMENSFTLLMQASIYALGLEESADFFLSASPEGQIEVSSSDPILREMVTALFAENPELGEQFLYIQALGNIEKTSQAGTPLMAQQAARANLGMQSVDIFIQAAASQGFGYSSLLGLYDGSSGGLSYFLGANMTV
ncbi:MAG: hypothetical protein FWF99_03605 [Desulfovibrionaceae bacterium]|nr:hypothetical protein [Desulfovibrionaceae bacterium]